MAEPNMFQHADLDGKSFEWSGGKTGILLFHGFTATTVEVRLMAKFLNDMGYTVRGPLLPGHGKTVNEMNHFSWKDLINCAEENYLALSKKCDKVFVMGESMGGLLSLALGLRHPEIAGIMVFAPALIVPGLGKAEWLWPFKSYVWKKNIDETMAWQGFNVVPLHAAAQLSKLQRFVRKNLSKMTVPTMIFQGKLDKSIDLMSSVKVLEGIQSEEKELVWLENSTHCILLDNQLPDTEEICLNFIRSHS
jgi:carboxylesterase